MNETFAYTAGAAYVEQAEVCLLHDECDVCLGEHDEAIHDATVNVHAWFRGEVTKYFECGEVDQKFVA